MNTGFGELFSTDSLQGGTQHTVAAEEAQASFCPNLAAANSRLPRKNPISPGSLTWKTELFSTDSVNLERFMANSF